MSAWYDLRRVAVADLVMELFGYRRNGAAGGFGGADATVKCAGHTAGGGYRPDLADRLESLWAKQVRVPGFTSASADVDILDGSRHSASMIAETGGSQFLRSVLLTESVRRQASGGSAARPTSKQCPDGAPATLVPGLRTPRRQLSEDRTQQHQQMTELDRPAPQPALQQPLETEYASAVKVLS